MFVLCGLLSAATWPSIDTPARTGQRAPQDAAVVVGIEDYAFLPDVPYAANDASAFYDLMVYTRGIPSDHVTKLEGGSREMILDAIQKASMQVGPGGTLWFYFAGHGAASPSTSQRMLLGDDARAQVAAFEARALRLEEIQAAVADKNLILILDTCYTGMSRSGEQLLSTRFAVPTYALSSKQTTEWTAAGPNQMSGPLESVQHGAFTYFVVGALRGWADGQLDGKQDGVVTAEEASLFVEQSLRSAQVRDQTPQLLTQDSKKVLAVGVSERSPLVVSTKQAPPSNNVPIPQNPPAPSRVASVKVGLSGSVSTVYLEAFGQKYELPTKVPPGSYAIRAVIDGVEYRTGSVVISDGQEGFVINCDASFMACKRE